MTLIVGIKCKEGVVVAADSGATLGDIPSGLSTIIQPVAKLEVVKAKAIIGVSGPVGIGQLYADSLNRVESQLQHLDTATACRKLRDEFLKDAKIALSMAETAVRVIGSQAARGVITSTIIAAAPKNTPELMQFDYQATPEVATADLPFVCIGSGQLIADPFLAFLRRLFWEHKEPTIAEARFAAVWTIHHAILVAPAGLSGPIRLSELKLEDGQPKARDVPEAELFEHLDFVRQTEERIAELRQVLRPTGTEPTPPPVPQTPKK